MTFSYSTRLFDYDNESRTFVGDAYTLTVDGYLGVFPSARQAFDIYNPMTSEARTFEFVRETDGCYLFENELDNLKCVINLNCDYGEEVYDYGTDQ